MSLDRSLRDIRHPNCKTRKYFGILPTASIIIPFHNEGMSTLLRTLHSIINRTPDELLKEIILVDDYSVKEWLGSKVNSNLASKITEILAGKLNSKNIAENSVDAERKT